jgi:hypothetical protein
MNRGTEAEAAPGQRRQQDGGEAKNWEAKEPTEKSAHNHASSELPHSIPEFGKWVETAFNKPMQLDNQPPLP